MAGPVWQSIDLVALGKYIEEHVPEIATPLGLKQFGGGQSNPTYQLTSPNGRRYVLRKKPTGTLLSKAAHRIEREFQIIQALGKTKVPVPKTYCLCEDGSIIGTPFYVMEFIDGRIISDPYLPGVSEEDRTEMWKDSIRTLAILHTVDFATVGLGSFGKSSGFYDRQVKTFTAISASQAIAVDVATKAPVGQVPHFAELVRYFQDKAKQPSDRATLVHGDYRIGNLIFHKTEPRVIGVLDWEMATIGHPLSDIASLTGPYSWPNCTMKAGVVVSRPDGSTEAIRGLPKIEQNLSWYSEITGWNPSEELMWGYAFGAFRDSIIMQGIAARYALRQATDIAALDHAKKMKPDAERAWSTVEYLKNEGGVRHAKL